MKISMKNRKIGYVYGSVSGHFSFRKEKSIAFESTLERDLLYLLEFNDSVIDVEEQPFTIEYTNHNGKLVTYTPDFLVHFQSLNSKSSTSPYPKSMIIEVKPNDILKKKFRQLRPKFKVATQYAQECDYIFKIYDESRIRGQDLENIMFLRRYKLMTYEIDEEKRILSHLNSVGHTTIDHILAFLYITEKQRAIALGQIYNLLSHKKIACDIGLRINLHTSIWLNDKYTEGNL